MALGDAVDASVDPAGGVVGAGPARAVGMLRVLRLGVAGADRRRGRHDTAVHGVGGSAGGGGGGPVGGGVAELAQQLEATGYEGLAAELGVEPSVDVAGPDDPFADPLGF